MESLVLENGLFEIVENILYIVGTIFAAILIALSISAYRNTHLRKLIICYYSISSFWYLPILRIPRT